jgi:hypothetical protein
MSVSLFARKAVLCGALSGLCTALLTAQTAYVPLGDEQAIPGAITGNEAHPHAALGLSGGFVVWNDNATDGDGMGVSATGLDTRLQPVQAPFRVNTIAKGDQENARVTLLSGGGAAFVWRGAPEGLPRVYARFLSSSNTWVAPDAALSPSGYAVRSAPSISTLSNGNVVVVWSAFNQRSTSSMDDVYGQVMSPLGERIGVPFAVNQFVSFNQRNPAVAALPSGGFAVVWASEQQRSPAEVTSGEFLGSAGEVAVDVFARLYDQSGNARVAEFAVNTNLSICANPAISVAADGRFLVAWSSGNSSTPTNSWDVVARQFSALGIGGATARVNTRIPGRQYGPSAAFLDDRWLLVWTSHLQDGSGKGVYGRFLGLDANGLSPEFRVNTDVVLDQDQPSVSADNFGRFMALWRTAHSQNRLQVDLRGRVFSLPGFESLAAATNFVGPVYAADGSGGGTGGGTNSVTPGTSVLDYPVIPTGSGVIPVAGAKGVYRGLIYNKDGVRPADAGYVTAVVGSTGGYTINFKMGLRVISLAGKFDPAGKAHREIPRGAGKQPLVLDLSVDLSGTDQLKGSLSDGSISGDFLADKTAYDTLRNPHPAPGRFNVAIEPPEFESGITVGAGYGSFLITKGGSILFAGKLADGSVVSQSSGVSRSGVWPLYAAPYLARGRVMGWIQITNTAASGKMVWIKPANSAAKLHPSGFSVETQFAGSRYSPPGAGERALSIPDGSARVDLTGGGMVDALRLPVFLDMNNRVVDATGSGVRVVLNPAVGSFEGSFVIPSTGKRVPFAGKLLQDGNSGTGFFINNNFSGLVILAGSLP